jgi:hypothetical protein
MFDCDSNFTMTKDFILAIVSKCNAITCSIILLKRCEHPLPFSYMICASIIKHPTRKNQALFLGNETCLDPFILVTRTLGTHTQVLGFLWCGPT